MSDENERTKLSARSRSDLDAIAAEHGVDAPEQLPNKAAVVEAIIAVSTPTERSFRIREDAAVDKEPVIGITFSDGVHIGADDIYTTSDERVAARMAADPMLEEVQQP
jgi:hypothetical protein